MEGSTKTNIYEETEHAIPESAAPIAEPAPVDNLQLLEIPRLSDAAREALVDVPLDPDNPVPAVEALYAAGFREDEVRGTMIEVLGALNLRAAQAAPAPEAPAGLAPEPEVAPEAEAAEAPAELAAVPEEDELSRLARELQLPEHVQRALTHVDLGDRTAVHTALLHSDVSRGEIQRILYAIAQRGQPVAEASVLPPAAKLEQRWRIPKLELPPRVAAALGRVDLGDPRAVREALQRFGSDVQTKTTEQLRRFRGAVATAVAKLPKKPAAEESVAQSSQQQKPEISVESQSELQQIEEVSADGETPQENLSYRLAAVLRRVEGASDSDILGAIRQQSVRAYREALAWRPELGKQDVRVAEQALLEAVREHAVRTRGGASGPSVPSEIPSSLEQLTKAYWNERSKKETPERERQAQARVRLRQSEASARMAEPSGAERALGKGSALEQELHGLSEFFGQIGTLKELQQDLVSAQRDARYANGKKQRSAQATVKEIEARIANYPSSVDDLLRRVDFPAGLRQAVNAKRWGEPANYEEQGLAGKHQKALYDGIIQDLNVTQIREPVVSEEIPAPERQAEAEPAPGAEGPERTNVTVNEEDVAAYADGIRSGTMKQEEYATLLSGMTGEQRDREVQTLRVAVDRLAREVQKPDADPAVAVRTKENLKKLGFALVGATGLVGLAAVDAIIKAIEDAIGETFKIAES